MTEKWIIENDDDFKNKSIPYTDMVIGTAVYDCPLHCTTTQITAVFLDEKTENNSMFSKIDIAFSHTVTVIKNVYTKLILHNFCQDFLAGTWSSSDIGVGVWFC